MKVFFDTNVYVADAIGGKAARETLYATWKSRWRIYASDYVLHETAHALTDYFGFSRRLARVVTTRIRSHSTRIREYGSAVVVDDPKDSPILQGALAAKADYLVSNDRHLLGLDPFESLRIISIHAYRQLLREHGLLA